MSERLQTTIKHLREGVTSMGLTAARHSIESWQNELRDYEGKPFETIVTDLGHLHDLLSEKEIDGKKVGRLLTKLGRETVSVAKNAEDENDLIAELGDQLERAGAQLDREKARA